MKTPLIGAPDYLDQIENYYAEAAAEELLGGQRVLGLDRFYTQLAAISEDESCDETDIGLLFLSEHEAWEARFAPEMLDESAIKRWKKSAEKERNRFSKAKAIGRGIKKAAQWAKNELTKSRQMLPGAAGRFVSGIKDEPKKPKAAPAKKDEPKKKPEAEKGDEGGSSGTSGGSSGGGGHEIKAPEGGKESKPINVKAREKKPKAKSDDEKIKRAAAAAKKASTAGGKTGGAGGKRMCGFRPCKPGEKPRAMGKGGDESMAADRELQGAGLSEDDNNPARHLKHCEKIIKLVKKARDKQKSPAGRYSRQLVGGMSPDGALRSCMRDLDDYSGPKIDAMRKRLKALLSEDRASGYDDHMTEDTMSDQFYDQMIAMSRGGFTGRFMAESREQRVRDERLAEQRGSHLRPLHEDSPLEAPTSGFSRDAKLMSPATREKVLEARRTEIEAFAEDRGLNPNMVMSVAEAAMRMGRVPELRQYGFSGDNAKAIKQFVAGEVLNIAIEDVQTEASMGGTAMGANPMMLGSAFMKRGAMFDAGYLDRCQQDEKEGKLPYRPRMGVHIESFNPFDAEQFLSVEPLSEDARFDEGISYSKAMADADVGQVKRGAKLLLKKLAGKKGRSVGTDRRYLTMLAQGKIKEAQKDWPEVVNHLIKMAKDAAGKKAGPMESATAGTDAPGKGDTSLGKKLKKKSPAYRDDDEFNFASGGSHQPVKKMEWREAMAREREARKSGARPFDLGEEDLSEGVRVGREVSKKSDQYLKDVASGKIKGKRTIDKDVQMYYASVGDKRVAGAMSMDKLNEILKHYGLDPKSFKKVGVFEDRAAWGAPLTEMAPSVRAYEQARTELKLAKNRLKRARSKGDEEAIKKAEAAVTKWTAQRDEYKKVARMARRRNG